MSKEVAISKDEVNQSPIPSAWRNTFSAIIEAFVNGDFRLERDIVGVQSVTEVDAKRIEQNIASYGATLTTLPEDTWNTSACQWMRGYWDVLIDLFTIEEGASDLALSVRVSEVGGQYIFEVQSVSVP